MRKQVHGSSVGFHPYIDWAMENKNTPKKF